MKKVSVFILTLALLAMFACTKTVDIEAEKAQVKTALEMWMDGWENEDMETFSKILAHDADMVTFGTDEAEPGTGPHHVDENTGELGADHIGDPLELQADPRRG